MIKVVVGDSIVVGTTVSHWENNNHIKKFLPMSSGAKVESIVPDIFTNQTVINLDWGMFGKSKVYLHDHKHSWIKAEEYN